MEREIYVKCPYCGKAGKVRVEFETSIERKALLCRSCSKLFAVELFFNIHQRTYKCEEA